MKKFCAILAALAMAGTLAGCGVSSGLKPAAGNTLPPAPYGARAKPSANQLLTPSTQARPDRSEELLTSSDNRRSDEFDLPPS